MLSLNDQWEFSKDQLHWEKINLPHTWNARDVMDDEPGYYRGTGWYRRSLRVAAQEKNKDHFIAFNGANQETEVFINGKTAGTHTGGYTRFVIPVSPFLNYRNDTLLVKVTNRFNADIAPLTADFTFFGGIYRNVNLLSLNPVHFSQQDHGSSGIFITTPKVSAEEASMQVSSILENSSGKAQKIQLRSRLVDAEGKTIATQLSSLTLSAGKAQTIVQQFKALKNPQLWSPDRPYLYRVISTLSTADQKTVNDELSSSVGFRWFSFDADKGFFLNGQPMKLTGASRHQDYEGLGNAVPDALQIRDIEYLKQMGGNFLRVAHYPQDPQILEACDRLGILASVEIPVVNTITESAAFTANCKNMQVEMIRQNFNHPSIVIWAYMNEILLRPKFGEDKARQQLYYDHVRALAQTLDSLTRKEDPSRYTMLVNHGAFDTYQKVGLTKIPMIVGWNLYSGWYGGVPGDFAKFLDRHHKELPDKPMIVTEYGADADPRIRSFAPVRFDKSLEYAVQFNQIYLNAILEKDFVSGGIVWNLADFSSESREETMPHINNKGLLTLGRQPKDIYYLYQAYLLKKPFVKIASSQWRERTGTADANGTSCTQPLQVTTNAAAAELFLNGKSLGIRKATDHVCTWEVPFLNGNNQLRAVAGSISDEMNVSFQLQPLRLADQQLPFTGINILLGSKRFYIDEQKHQLWVPDQPYQQGAWGYIGGEPFKGTNNRITYGSDKNILGTEDDPVYQTQQVGIEEFRLDVPDGVYDISLCFAELLGGTEKEALAYNLDNNHVKEKAEQRIFDVFVNGTPLLRNFNLAAEYGYATAVEKKTRVIVSGGKGLRISFNAIKGKPVLNAIAVRKVW